MHRLPWWCRFWSLTFIDDEDLLTREGNIDRGDSLPVTVSWGTRTSGVHRQCEVSARAGVAARGLTQSRSRGSAVHETRVLFHRAWHFLYKKISVMCLASAKPERRHVCACVCLSLWGHVTAKVIFFWWWLQQLFMPYICKFSTDPSSAPAKCCNISYAWVIMDQNLA